MQLTNLQGKLFRFRKAVDLQMPSFMKRPAGQLRRISPIAGTRRILKACLKYKSIVLLSAIFSILVTAALWKRAEFIAGINNIKVSPSPEVSVPTLDPAIFGKPENEREVLGAETLPEEGSSDFIQTIPPSPYPTIPPVTVYQPPVPTSIAFPTFVPGNSNTTSGNSNCTTPEGVPNSWYSDVYPNPPITTNNGSVTLIVVLRDCFKNTVPVDDEIEVTLLTGDTTARIGGKASPVKFNASRGELRFDVSSENTQTNTYEIQNRTSSFRITDVKNNNPTVRFVKTPVDSNCTTGAGVPNFWYSEISPVSPVVSNTGTEVNFSVSVKDCSKNIAMVSDTIKVSQVSGGPGLRVNGKTLPVSLKTVNGMLSFSAVSDTPGVFGLSVRDETGSFDVTDRNNRNPSIEFKYQASAATATKPPSTPVPATSPNASVTAVVTVPVSATPTAVPVLTPSATPVPS